MFWSYKDGCADSEQNVQKQGDIKQLILTKLTGNFKQFASSLLKEDLCEVTILKFLINCYSKGPNNEFEYSSLLHCGK